MEPRKLLHAMEVVGLPGNRGLQATVFLSFQGLDNPAAPQLGFFGGAPHLLCSKSPLHAI